MAMICVCIMLPPWMRGFPPNTKVPLFLSKTDPKLATYNPLPGSIVLTMVVVVEFFPICPLPNAERSAVYFISNLEWHF